MDIHRLDLRRLHYFTVVAEELHFGRAASRLNMAQPPLSQQIRRLEADLDLSLFNRNTRKVELTDAGRMLLTEAVAVLSRSGDLLNRVEQFRSGGSGVLRIGFVDSASYDVLPRFIRNYQNHHPNVTYELRTLTSDEQRVAILTGEIDLGIGRADFNDPQVTSTTIRREPLLIAVGSEHRLADQKSARLGRLKGEPQIGFDRAASPTLHLALQSLFAAHGLGYNPVLEASEYTTVLSLVASGQGVAIVPASVRTFQPPGLRYLRLADDQAHAEFRLYRRAGGESKLVENAVELVHVGG